MPVLLNGNKAGKFFSVSHYYETLIPDAKKAFGLQLTQKHLIH